MWNEFGPSKLKRDTLEARRYRRDSLLTILMLITIGAIVIVELSGLVDSFINSLGNLIWERYY